MASTTLKQDDDEGGALLSTNFTDKAELEPRIKNQTLLNSDQNSVKLLSNKPIENGIRYRTTKESENSPIVDDDAIELISGVDISHNGDREVEEQILKVEAGQNDLVETSEYRPPDGGWGWVVVFGASLILVLVDTIGQCFGVIFSRFLLQLETPTVVTSWIFNLFSFIWCMTGPPLGPLVNEFGWRMLTFVGSFLLTIATISSAFVSSAWVLFFTYSLLAGIGCGIISNISYMIIPHYFEKRRGLANGIIMAFDCGGQFVGPPLIGALQDHYTYKGATLILGGVILNCCIGAAVFHPVKWHSKEKIYKPQEEIINSARNQVDSPKERLQETQTKVLLRILKSTIKDLSILKSWRAIIISMGATVIFNGYLNFLAIVPFAMQEAGYSLSDAAVCVSISAICNMSTRVIVATLSDNKRFNFQISMMIGSLTIAGTMITFPLVHHLGMMKFVMAVWGCGVGMFMSIFNLVMVHYMGLESLMPMLGASMLCIAFGYLSIGPFAGYIRDITQSYAICIWFLAGVVLLAFIMWIFMPAAVAYDLKKKKHPQHTDSNQE